MSKKTITIIFIILITEILAVASIYVYANYNNEEATISNAPVHHRHKRTSEARILMFGRSVMAGWFNHWGSDTTKPVQKEGYNLEYRQLESPPNIIESFETQIDKLTSQEKPIIFFKLCFTDFGGTDQIDVEDNLVRNEKYIEQVYNITKQNNLKLIIGNTLPQVRGDVTQHLIWNQLNYNQWLLDFRAQHQKDVFIFDMYKTLTDSSGSLKKEFASSSSDSHPNNAGYSALDKTFFTMLKNNF